MHLFRRDTSVLTERRLALAGQRGDLHFEAGLRRVVFLPGRDVCDRHPARDVHIGSGIKTCERMFGGFHTYALQVPPDGNNPGVKQVDVLALSYSEPIRNLDIEMHFKRPDQQISHDAQNFVNFMLLPMINDNDREIRLDKKYSVAELKERLSHITFVGHSYGGIFAQEIANYLRGKLRAEGYSDDVRAGEKESDVTSILRSVISISIANIAPMNRVEDTQPRETSFRTLCFTASNDESAKKSLRGVAKLLMLEPDPESPATTGAVVADYQKKLETMQRRLLQGAGYGDTRGQFRMQPSEAGYFISQRIPEAKEWQEVRNGQVIDRKIDKTTADEMQMDIRHDLRNHMIPDAGHQEYPSAIRRSMRNAIMRGPDVETVLEMFKQIPDGIFPKPGEFRPRKGYFGDRLTDVLKGALKPERER